jgi:glycosyltransferase involved in cell wall biosynthesis
LTQGRDKVAVSLTPVAAGSDSRTIRVAESLARAGYRSLIWESVASPQDPCVGLSCALVGASGEVKGEGALPRSIRTAGRIAPLLTGARQGRFGLPGELALYAALRFEHRRRYEVRGRIPPASLYYVHSYELYRAVSGLAASLGAPVIYDAHDFYQGIRRQDEMPSFDRRWMMPFFRRREAECVAGCDGLVTVSEGTADLIESAFGRRPVVLRNAHDPRLDRAPARSLRQTIGLSGEDRLFVVAGNYKPGMAVRELLDALVDLEDRVHVAFVGNGYEEGLVGFSGHPARARLHIGLGRSSREVVPFISDADAGLVIYKSHSENYREALPNGFFQVLAAGLPIVYPALPQLLATIGEARVGQCVEAFTAATMGRALRTLLDAPRASFPDVAALSLRLSWLQDEQRLLSLVADVTEARAGRLDDPPMKVLAGQEAES